MVNRPGSAPVRSANASTIRFGLSEEGLEEERQKKRRAQRLSNFQSYFKKSSVAACFTDLAEMVTEGLMTESGIYPSTLDTRRRELARVMKASRTGRTKQQRPFSTSGVRAKKELLALNLDTPRMHLGDEGEHYAPNGTHGRSNNNHATSGSEQSSPINTPRIHTHAHTQHSPNGITRSARRPNTAPRSRPRSALVQLEHDLQHPNKSKHGDMPIVKLTSWVVPETEYNTYTIVNHNAGAGTYANNMKDIPQTIRNERVDTKSKIGNRTKRLHTGDQNQATLHAKRPSGSFTQPTQSSRKKSAHSSEHVQSLWLIRVWHQKTLHKWRQMFIEGLRQGYILREFLKRVIKIQSLWRRRRAKKSYKILKHLSMVQVGLRFVINIRVRRKRSAVRRILQTIRHRGVWMSALCALSIRTYHERVKRCQRLVRAWRHMREAKFKLAMLYWIKVEAEVRRTVLREVRREESEWRQKGAALQTSDTPIEDKLLYGLEKMQRKSTALFNRIHRVQHNLGAARLDETKPFAIKVSGLKLLKTGLDMNTRSVAVVKLVREKMFQHVRKSWSGRFNKKMKDHHEARRFLVLVNRRQTNNQDPNTQQFYWPACRLLTDELGPSWYSVVHETVIKEYQDTLTYGVLQTPEEPLQPPEPLPEKDPISTSTSSSDLSQDHVPASIYNSGVNTMTPNSPISSTVNLRKVADSRRGSINNMNIESRRGSVNINVNIGPARPLSRPMSRQYSRRKDIRDTTEG